MRAEFSKSILKILDMDPKSILITGDLGYTAFEEIIAKHRKRFLNAGVAEQNMIGVAAGISVSGFHPWVYSIIPFVTIRALEQIRNDICFHNLPVRIVGNGGGYSYGVMGSTHHALEDIGLLKGLPNMSLFFPAANDQVDAAVQLMSKLKGPGYLRLAVSPYATAQKPLSENPDTLTRQYSVGGKITLIGVGHAVQIALSALGQSEASKIDADVFSLSRFPFDWASDTALVQSVQKTGRVIVVEEHYEVGGIGESLKASLPNTQSFQRMAAHYFKEQRYGSSKFHLQQSRLTPEEIILKMEQIK